MDFRQWTQHAEPLGPSDGLRCPADCGICADHQIGTCCILLEVTKRCNLRCRFCFANGGTAVEGSILLGETGKMSTLISPDTAQAVREMMNYNVQYSYGTWNFPGLNVCAKSGTAEVGDGSSHSWFTGFLDDEEHPYAFTVMIEGGGSGLRNAGAVANTVLQELVNITLE